jgi:hypothetical protein
MVYYGVPSLGAVKLDITGTVEGIDVKIGFDYVAPKFASK